jgi:hypothetical protein
MAGYNHKPPAAKFQVSLIGRKFGRLLVELETRSAKNKRAWVVKCECGTVRVYETSTLTKIKSCGCSWSSPEARQRTKQQFTKHGNASHRTTTKAYKAWNSMRQRCNNQNALEYHNYGARGISICERWNDFVLFLADMGEPASGDSLERNDVNGHYCKENCRWIPIAQQACNRRDTVWLDAFEERKTMAEWSRDPRCVVPYYALRTRIVRGWTAEEAITIPLGRWIASERRKRAVG